MLLEKGGQGPRVRKKPPSLGELGQPMKQEVLLSGEGSSQLWHLVSCSLDGTVFVPETFVKEAQTPAGARSFQSSLLSGIRRTVLSKVSMVP